MHATKISHLGFAVAILSLTPSVARAASPSPAAQLIASDAAASDRLGVSLSLSGDTVVVGAHLEEHDEVINSGAAYVFVRDGESWREEAKLMPASAVESGDFAARVAIDGNTAIVSAHNEAYVFVRQGSTWSEEAILTVEDAWIDGFGYYALAISGDRAVIGAPWANEHAGTAYVFVRSAGHWQLEASLKPSDPRANGYFGSSLAISETSILVGAYGDSEAGFGCGAAYVFSLDGDTWTEESKLIESSPTEDNLFGFSLALSGDTALISSMAGPSTIFVRSGGAWTEQAQLSADTATSEGFGSAVALVGDTALIGAPFAAGQAGSAHLFVREAGSWIEANSFTAGQPDQENLFGISVALSESFALVGAPQDGVSGADSGSAYLFSVQPEQGAEPGDSGGCSAGSGKTSALALVLLALLALGLGRRRSEREMQV